MQQLLPGVPETAMRIDISPDKVEMGRRAAAQGATILRECLRKQSEARLVLATGVSQFTVLAALLQAPDIDWHRVTLFHLDEYLGLPPTHPASFRKFLWDRFVKQLKVPLKAAFWIDGQAAPELECKRLAIAIDEKPVALAFVGIGENGHLAFNDPPADMTTSTPYILVQLDEACRRQQIGEGWFPSMDSVPTHAISMSIQQIMKIQHIICSVPDDRKAQAVKSAV
ncbi:MAG TPA: 6-phosphogluconolactonase, partial [Gemmatales bacterium]|nr:6-phosphogluconolactonase [Gemmatales bacterium]